MIIYGYGVVGVWVVSSVVVFMVMCVLCSLERLFFSWCSMVLVLFSVRLVCFSSVSNVCRCWIVLCVVCMDLCVFLFGDNVCLILWYVWWVSVWVVFLGIIDCMVFYWNFYGIGSVVVDLFVGFMFVRWGVFLCWYWDCLVLIRLLLGVIGI